MCSIDTATPWREHAHTCVMMCCALAFDWSAHRLRAAEAKAKANKVRLWKGYTAVERATPVSANAKFSGVVRVSTCMHGCLYGYLFVFLSGWYEYCCIGYAVSLACMRTGD